MRNIFTSLRLITDVNWEDWLESVSLIEFELRRQPSYRALDFRTRDIGCRQARPGFEFATRLRWALDGSPVTPGATALVAAPGGEQAGEWVWPRPGAPDQGR